MPGKLYIVPTPIGNLEDITLRAIGVLKQADAILAEDTRTSAVLLNHHGIHTPLLPYHKFNEHKTLQKIVDQLLAGKTFALISDAGTPGISDPGFLIARECIRHQIDIETLAGATAFVPALINSGLPAHEFAFIGFLPLKKGRATKLREVAAEKRTVILYESPHRLVKTLQQLLECAGDRRASVSRELSKKFEETARGSLSELIAHFTLKSPKGEFVIVLEGGQ